MMEYLLIIYFSNIMLKYAGMSAVATYDTENRCHAVGQQIMAQSKTVDRFECIAIQ